MQRRPDRPACALQAAATALRALAVRGGVVYDISVVLLEMLEG